MTRAKPRLPQPPPVIRYESYRALRFLLPLAMLLLVLTMYAVTPPQWLRGGFGMDFTGSGALHTPPIIDDVQMLSGHPDVVEPEGLTRLWFNDYWAGLADDTNLYRPLTILSLHLNARTWAKPAAFRTVNMLILVGVGCLAAVWMGRYVRRTAAWLAAALLVAHPLNAELIRYIVGRADLQAMLGILAFLYVQRLAIEAGGWRWYQAVAAVLGAALAFGSKESGLVLLPLAAVQAWIGPPGKHTHEHNPHRARTILHSALLLAMPLAAYLLLRAHVVGWWVTYPPISLDLTGNPLRGKLFLERLPTVAWTFWHYAKQVVIPDTSFNHAPSVLPSWSNPAVIAGVALLVLLGLLLLRCLKRRDWLALPITLALSHFLIVGNLLVVTGVLAANRLALPFVLAALCGVAAVLSRVVQPSVRHRAIAVVPVTLVVVALLPFVWQVNCHWDNALIRMRADLDAHPANPVTMFQYGTELALAGETTDALPWLEQAVDARPQSTQGRTTLGALYLGLNRLDESAAQFAAVVEKRPHDWGARLRLGEVYLIKNDLARAREQIETAEKLAPNEPEVLYNLAQLAQATGHYGEALQRYEALLTRAPAHRAGRQQYEQLRSFLMQYR